MEASSIRYSASSSKRLAFDMPLSAAPAKTGEATVGYNNNNNNNNNHSAGLLKLDIASQNYAWGKPASSSMVAKLLNKSADGKVPYAELWMGTHKNGPSRVMPAPSAVAAMRDDGEGEEKAMHPQHISKVGEVAEQGEERLKWAQKGENKRLILLSEHLAGDLPYLFKILSIARALSIQVHPNKSVAERLHATRPHVYKDANHKPEMAVALTPFEAMCGFRPLQQVLHFLTHVKEFANIVGKEVKNEFVRCVTDVVSDASGAKEREDALKKVFESVMKAEKKDVEREVANMVRRISDEKNGWKIPNYAPSKAEDAEMEEKSDDGSSVGSGLESSESDSETSSSSFVEFARDLEINELVLRLNREFPKDVGVFAVFFLNCFRLREGEAVYLSANLPHAYLSGDCIECMACSDNVVRAGLTPKLRDTDVLCDIVEYVAQEPQIMLGQRVTQHTVQYAPHVKEFRLSVTSLDAEKCEKLDISEDAAASDEASILLVYEGNGRVNGVDVTQGDCLLVPQNVQVLDMQASASAGADGVMRVARCYAPSDFKV